MTVFETKVLSIGPEAELFKEEKMVILFGEDAPDALADYCYNIELNPIIGTIEKGLQLIVDEEAYEITAVGSVVQSNLENLGHITIRFNGEIEAELPGTLYVEDKKYQTS